ncbi:Translin [Xylariaceae sp. FL0255]|nr:Translin [Xylariaceae sp. FL0255]
MSEVIVPKKRDEPNSGVKRDHRGKEKTKDWRPAAGSSTAAADQAQNQPRNAYTSMFETFRDELDEHHDRRQRISKVSRDVTALSKKIIFSLHRVRKLAQPIPPRIQSEIDERLVEIGDLLKTIASDVQGMNRHRYALICLEEFVEAISFAHYLRHGTLMRPAEAQAELDLYVSSSTKAADDTTAPSADVAGDVSASPTIELLSPDYVFGIFDLTGEMMRFATAVTALSGGMPSAVTAATEKEYAEGQRQNENDGKNAAADRTILTDMQDVSSMLQIYPIVAGKPGTYSKKLDIMIEQIRKVERLGYGVVVRGNERPKGWMPNLEEGGAGGEDVVMD